MSKPAQSVPRQLIAGVGEMALGLLGVLLVWVVIFGWRGELLSGNDSFLETYLIEHLQAADGDWSERPYDHRVMGGVAAHSTYGSVWLYRWGVQIGLNAQSTYNFAVLALQVLMGLLSLWILRVALSRLKTTPTAPSVQRCIEAFSFLIFAFLPWWGWRIGYGHAIHLFGFIALPATLYLLLAYRFARAEIWPVLWAAISIGIALSSAGAQILFYSSTVLAVVTLTLVPGVSPRRIFPLVLLGLGVMAWSFPAGVEVVSHYLSGATARGDAAQPVIYSYLPHSVSEWFKSLTWLSMGEAGLSHPQYFWNEVDVAWGLWILAAAGAWRWKALRWALLAYVLLGFVIAAITYQWSPISEALLAIGRALSLPVDGFRVPSRWIWVWGYPVQVLAWVVIAHRWMELAQLRNFETAESNDPRWRRIAGLAVFALVVLMMQLGGVWSELAVVLSLAFALELWSKVPLIGRKLHSHWRNLLSSSELRFVGLLALLCAQLMAFSSRLLPMTDLAELNKLRDHAGIVRELGPTERMTLRPLLPGFGSQSIAALGGSGIDGNWIMPKNFLHLLSALEGQPPQAAAVIWSFRPGYPFEAWLREVFHVHRHLEMTAQGPVWSGQSPAVSAKLASRIERVDSWDQWPKIASSRDKARDTLWVLAEDHGFADQVRGQAKVDQMPIELSENCRQIQVRDEAWNWTGQIVYQARVESDRSINSCVAILPFGFHSQLRAVWKDAKGEVELATTRAQGAIIAVLWPADSQFVAAPARGELKLVWRHILSPTQALASLVLGWILVIGGLFLTVQRSDGSISNSDS